MMQNERKQVMLSYNYNSKQIVEKIFNILKEKNILVCYDDRHMEDNISDGYRF